MTALDLTDRKLVFATRSLNFGHNPPDIRASLVEAGCSLEEADEVIERAAAGINQRREAERKATQKAGLCLLAAGLAMLVLAYYAGSGHVPSGRYGRLLMGYIFGGGASLVGLWMLIK
ncbi:hypothetical protein AMC83_PA00053 (plasmid) [Rhizobium phaseoli]|uniref:hypothetical protein n=1 Tax=Rhizobium phaseoli TaxID=396 RepID=UPI0007EAAB44|nr:hypothetical protein [Rhizobium phaseoli]ANL74280.1 hypothetical protein AMC83_PA00053 [Rhizobium phaseoli]